MSEEFWEGRYREQPQIWSGRPNAQLVAVVSALPPGAALDLGCGEGGDAVWMAQQGWRVTAVDVSQTALDRAAARAQELGVASRISFQQKDLATAGTDGEFDLVSAQFLQSPVDFPRDEVLRRAAGAVAPGGLLLIVDHASAPPWGKHAHTHALPTTGETFASLALPRDGWTVEVLQVREREASGPDGETATLRDNVIALRRQQ
ncbi:MAG: SAM-dependent methyltransferase [Solirubrobacteraceae bacterium]